MRMVLDGKLAAGSCAQASVVPRRNAVNAANAFIGSSIEFRAGGLDDLRPSGEVGPDLRGEFFRRVADRLDAVAVQSLEEVRAPDDRDGVVVDFLHDLARRSRGREKSIPGGDVEAGQGFRDRGHFGPVTPSAFSLPLFVSWMEAVIPPKISGTWLASTSAMPWPKPL